MSQFSRLPPRGARSYASLDLNFVAALERAEVESRTHVEQMAIDMAKLMGNVFPEAAGETGRVEGLRFLARMRMAAQILLDTIGPREALARTRRSASDTVRGWGAFAVGQAEALTLAKRVELMRPFVNEASTRGRSSTEWTG